MKIGFVSSVYPEDADDVRGNFVHRLALGLTAQGHEITVVSPYRGGLTSYTLESIKITKFHYFWPHRWELLCGQGGMAENIKKGLFVKSQLIPYSLMVSWMTFRALRHLDLVHVFWPIPNALGPWLAKPFTRQPYVTTVFGAETYLAKRYHFDWLLKWLVNGGKNTVVISEATKAVCASIGCHEVNMVLIPMGVRTDTFYPKPVPRDKTPLSIISVGYLVERKGFDYLIKSFAKVVKTRPGSRLRIVGTGPRRDELLTLITELGLVGVAEILEGVTNAELADLYNAADIFVLSSITDSLGNTEGLGIVMLEAMACRIPVVASDVGGISDVIDTGQNGLLVPEKDVDALAKAILKLSQDSVLRRRLAHNGYHTAVEKFGWEKIATRYIEVYRNVLHTKL